MKIFHFLFKNNNKPNFNKTSIYKEDNKLSSFVKWQSRIKNFTISPFKKKIQYFFISFILFSFLFLALLFYNNYSTIAATYYFIQNSWEGGEDTSNFPFHPENNEGWNRYYQKEEGIEANQNIKLKTLPGLWDQKTESDFNEGEHNSTSIKGSGENAVITLD